MAFIIEVVNNRDESTLLNVPSYSYLFNEIQFAEFSLLVWVTRSDYRSILSGDETTLLNVSSYSYLLSETQFAEF